MFDNLLNHIIDEMKLSPDDKEVQAISKKFRFGSVEWQNAMIDRVINKLKAGQSLSDHDIAFIDTQLLHNELIMNKLKELGWTPARRN